MTHKKHPDVPLSKIWECICPCAYGHQTPEDCARKLKTDLYESIGKVSSLETFFGVKEGLATDLKCACGGPLFRYTDPEDKTRICPFCASRYIQYLKKTGKK
jgi:hypothetical protein